MIEPFSPQTWTAADIADPYPIYQRYRALDPIHQAAPGVWYVFDHDTVAHVLARRDFGRTAPAHLPARDDALRRSVENWLVFLDPPRHTRLRRLLAAEFTPQVVADLRPTISAICADLALPLAGRNEFDFTREFAAPLPVLVISALLGVPPSLHGWFRERAEWLQRASSTQAARDPGGYASATVAARELTAYFAEQVRLRKLRPQPDLVSLLANTPELTSDEITGTCVHLLTAGHETTTNMLGKAVLALLSHPELADRLRTSPGLVPAAVDELIRYDPPVQMVTRWAVAAQSLGDKEIRAGDKVVLVLGSATRDQDRFEAPDQLRLDRDTSRHCAFGLGIHYCLGAQLARAEVEIALPLLLELAREKVAGVTRYAEDLVFHGPAELVLRAGHRPAVRRQQDTSPVMD